MPIHEGPYAKHKNAPPTCGIKVNHCLKSRRETALLLLGDVLTEGMIDRCVRSSQTLGFKGGLCLILPHWRQGALVQWLIELLEHVRMLQPAGLME